MQQSKCYRRLNVSNTGPCGNVVFQSHVQTLTLLVVFTIVSILSAAKAVDKDYVLEQFVQSTHNMTTYAIHIETKSTWNNNGKLYAPEINSWDVIRDSERIDINRKSYVFDEENKEEIFLARSIWDQNQFLTRQGEPNPENGPMVLASHNQDRISPLLTSSAGGIFVDGYFEASGEHCGKLLLKTKNVSIDDVMNEIDGNPCYVIRGSTAHGKYTLWIDPEHGFNLRKALVEKGPNDLFYGEPMADVYPVGGGPNYIGARIEINDVNIVKIEGHYIAVSGNMAQTRRKKDGTWDEITYETKRTNIDLKPNLKSMGAFVMDKIPNGTHVSHLDFKGIRYVWQNGKVITDIQSELVDILDQDVKLVSAEFNGKEKVTPETTAQPQAQKTNERNDEERPRAKSMVSSRAITILCICLFVIIFVIVAMFFRYFQLGMRTDG